MNAIREASHQDLQRIGTQWRRRDFDVQARDGMLARLFKEKSVGKISGGTLLQFARFCVVGASMEV